jgi:hypothetical protein
VVDAVTAAAGIWIWRDASGIRARPSTGRAAGRKMTFVAPAGVERKHRREAHDAAGDGVEKGHAA